MASSIDDKDFPKIEVDDLDVDLQDCPKESSLISLIKVDSNAANLDAVRESILRSLSCSPSDFLKDRALLDSLPLACKLLIESFEETENILTRDSPSLVSTEEIRSKLNLWQSSLEPWHEFLKHLKNLGTVPCNLVQSLLDSLPAVIQVVFSHCKKSGTLYGPKFDDLRLQLTGLFRQTNIVLDVFFTILDTTVKFDVDLESEKNSLSTVFDKIGDIAVLTNGVDRKTHLNTWKAFLHLSLVHESLLKKLRSTECITRRLIDIAKDIENLLFQSYQDKKDKKYERMISCAGLLLKLLSRLCSNYRGYCGNKVSNVLVQLLTKLYRYSPPFPSERFIHLPPVIAECMEHWLGPGTYDLLNTLFNVNEFSKAFFQYGKSQVEDPICYHLLTLRIIEELAKRQQSDLSVWLKEDDNIIDVALANMNDCCEDILVNKFQVPVRLDRIPATVEHLGIYEATLQTLCVLVARTSTEDFAAVEIALLKHLLNGEFWSSLLSCDTWTYLGRIATPELCYEHLSFFIKLQKLLITREKSLEFQILNNLIGRLYKFLPDELKDSLFREIDDLSNRRLVDPFRESLTSRAQQYLRQNPSIDTTNNLPQIFQDLRRSPSVKNWTRLTSLLRSIGALAWPKDERLCIVTLRNIWSFLASSIPKSGSITRDMLLELAILLLDCTQPNCADNSGNDRLIASIYKSMLETTEHVSIQHKMRMNLFLRENLRSCVHENGKLTLASITELFCNLVNDDNPWVRQECFETYAEYIIKDSSVQLFDSLSVGISQLPRICQQMPLYFSNEKIYNFNHHSSLENYLRDLALTSRDRSTWHKCYEPDFRQRDEKMPRLEIGGLDKRIDDLCKEIQDIIKIKNELSDDSMDRVRAALLQLLEPSG